MTYHAGLVGFEQGSGLCIKDRSILYEHAVALGSVVSLSLPERYDLVLHVCLLSTYVRYKSNTGSECLDGVVLVLLKHYPQAFVWIERAF